MTKTPKYRAKHVYWDAEKQIVIDKETASYLQRQNNNKRPECIWRFDSQHEFRVYSQLVKMFGANCVVRQHKIRILPDCCCYPNGKFWRVDFAIIGTKNIVPYDFLVEAKGAFLPEFANILVNLEQFNPNAFIRTFVIFDSQLPKENRVIKALLDSSFNSHLLTLSQLQQRKTLL